MISVQLIVLSQASSKRTRKPRYQCKLDVEIARLLLRKKRALSEQREPDLSHQTPLDRHDYRICARKTNQRLANLLKSWHTKQKNANVAKDDSSNLKVKSCNLNRDSSSWSWQQRNTRRKKPRWKGSSPKVFSCFKNSRRIKAKLKRREWNRQMSCWGCAKNWWCKGGRKTQLKVDTKQIVSSSNKHWSRYLLTAVLEKVSWLHS